MRSLVAVAEHGAITEAAAALGLSQPALSRRIQQLEEELGTELLERSRRGVVLTDAGRRVVSEGRVLIERYEGLQRSVREHLQLDVGTVRIGGGATAVSFLVPPAIAAFRKSHPRIVFQLKEAGSREVEQAVLDERLELGIVTLPARSLGLTATQLLRDRIVLVAARDHPLASQKTIGLNALRGQGLVGFEAGSAIRQHVDGALREAGVEMDVMMELRSIPSILQMVATTRSLAFVSELGIASAGRGVRMIGVRGLRIVRDLATIQTRGRPLSPAAAAFAKTLADTITPGSRARPHV